MHELKMWLESNKDHLKDYSLDEKVDLAIAAGMDRIAVAQWRASQTFQEIV